jgi:hypothetical protein
MVDPRKHRHSSERPRLRINACALTKRLELLTHHSDNAVVSAARITLQHVRRYEPLDARSFDKLYFEIVRQGRTLTRDRQLHEWKTVRDVGTGVYHALLRQLREDVKEQRASRPRRERRATERERREPAGE